MSLENEHPETQNLARHVRATSILKIGATTPLANLRTDAVFGTRDMCLSVHLPFFCIHLCQSIYLPNADNKCVYAIYITHVFTYMCMYMYVCLFV